MDLGNSSGSQVSVLWTAELQARLPSGMWVPVGIATGTIDLPPGGASYTDRFSESLPLGTTRVKVKVDIVQVGLPLCTDMQRSNERSPCGL
jgi:hypothetical protein